MKDAVAEINHLAYRMSEEGPRPSFVGSFIKPKLTYVLHRGSPENPRDIVMPGAPKILQGDLGMKNDLSGHARRARFAEWVVNNENPLTARAWQIGFGSMFSGLESSLPAVILEGQVPCPHILSY